MAAATQQTATTTVVTANLDASPRDDVIQPPAAVVVCTEPSTPSL
jgi:hypothetical protein